MKQAVVGILAHVDAGKSTLAEAMLFAAGSLRKMGRVDHGDSHLDTYAMERSRGITIFSKQAVLDYEGMHLMLVDTPGHVDFCAEAERTLQVLDYAVLVVGANDGVQGHTETLWRLLDRYNVPTFVFVNKMDLAQASEEELLCLLQERLGDGCVEASTLEEAQAQERIAMEDEEALDEFLETGKLAASTMRRLVSRRKVFPCFFGSALKSEGVVELLQGISHLVDERVWPAEFAARVYKISHGDRGERVTWLKVTGGCLRPRMLLKGAEDEATWEEKVDQLRIYSGEKFTAVDVVKAGQVCAATGLSKTHVGDALGYEEAGVEPLLEPVLAYSVLPGDCDVHNVYEALEVLADEDPMLGVSWSEQLQEIRLQLMGAIQLEVVRDTLAQRFGFKVNFGPGSIIYRETIEAPVIGVGHFEPLRHYAEAHLLLEPLPAGSGMEFGTVCSLDALDLNWQRLILTNAMEREHLGVLTGSPITDMRITLLAGRAHAKHTEGGDFRQATYRAIRQGLMQAKSVLLEPWYRFELEVPQDKVGRALSDLQRMSARFEAPTTMGERCKVAGVAPASEMQDYPLQVATYTHGCGSLFMVLDGYRPCHNADEVIAAAAYNPEADLPNTPDSVFCSHGAGYTVKWQGVPSMAHVDRDAVPQRPYRAADSSFFANS